MVTAVPRLDCSTTGGSVDFTTAEEDTDVPREDDNGAEGIGAAFCFPPRAAPLALPSPAAAAAAGARAAA